MSVKDEILQYLSKYNKTNICFPKLFFCKGNLSEKENEQQLVDSIFGNCGKKEGIEVRYAIHPVGFTRPYHI